MGEKGLGCCGHPVRDGAPLPFPPVSSLHLHPNPRPWAVVCRYAAYGCYDALDTNLAGSSGGGVGLVSACPGSTKLHLDMSDAVNVLAYVHVPSHARGGGSVVASCADEFVGGEGEWLARQRGAVGECTPATKGGGVHRAGGRAKRFG
eukprot:scaffold20739_cov105-Isochrysis_galbana.AAC.4